MKNKRLVSVFSSSHLYPAVYFTNTEHKNQLKQQLQLKQVFTVVSSVFRVKLFGGMAISRHSSNITVANFIHLEDG
jgi:hypothetical protein